MASGVRRLVTVAAIAAVCAGSARADDGTGLFTGLHCDNPFAAAGLYSILVKPGALADAVFTGDQHRRVRHDDRCRDERVTFFQIDPPDAAGRAAH